MKQVYDGKLYDTETATFLARNDTSLELKPIKKVELYRSLNGRYFSFTYTESASLNFARDDATIKPLSADEAIAVYNKLTKRELDFTEAFPDLQFTEA